MALGANPWSAEKLRSETEYERKIRLSRERSAAPSPAGGSVWDFSNTAGSNAEAADMTRQRDARAARDRAAMVDAPARANEELAAAARAAVKRRSDAASARLGDPAALAQDQQSAGLDQFTTAFDAQGRRVASTGPRPGHAETKGYTDTMLGTPDQYKRDKKGKLILGQDGRPILIAPATDGLVAEGREAQVGVDQAQLEQQRITAEGFEEMADRQLEAMTMLRANQEAQARRGNEQLARVQRINDLSLKAANDLNESEKIDPGRHWRNQPAFFKFLAILGAGLRGWAGAPDPTSHITGAIAADIDAQKADIAKMQANVGNLQGQSAREESVYQQIRAQTADDREADLTYTAAMLEHAKSQMVAQLQRAGIQQLTADQQISMNAIDQKIADVRRQLGLVAAANTPTVTTVRSPYNADQRRSLGKLADAGIANMTAGRNAAIDTAQKREEQSGRMQIEGAKLEAERAKEERKNAHDLARGPHGIVSEVQGLDSKFLSAEGVIGLIDAFERDNAGKDIAGSAPGMGIYGIPGTDSGATKKAIAAIEEGLGRAQSDGAITKDELVTFREMIRGGAAWGGDEALRQNLTTVKKMLSGRVNAAKSTLSPEALEYYDSRRHIRRSGLAGVDDPVQPTVVE